MSNSLNRNLDLNSENQLEVKPNTDQRSPLIEQSTELGSMSYNIYIKFNFSWDKRSNRNRYNK